MFGPLLRAVQEPQYSAQVSSKYHQEWFNEQGVVWDRNIWRACAAMSQELVAIPESLEQSAVLFILLEPVEPQYTEHVPD